jgi:hypothetical protein
LSRSEMLEQVRVILSMKCWSRYLLQLNVWAGTYLLQLMTFGCDSVRCHQNVVTLLRRW